MSGAIDKRVEVLMAQNQFAVAYACAKRHGLDDLAKKASQELELEVISRIDLFLETDNAKQRLLVPPIPLHRESQGSDWPLEEAENIARPNGTGGFFDIMMKRAEECSVDFESLVHTDISPDQNFKDAVEDDENEAIESIDTQAWGGYEGDWFGLGASSVEPVKADTEKCTAPTTAVPIDMGIPKGTAALQANSSYPSISDCVSSGKFTQAVELLKTRIGLVDASVLLPVFKIVFQASQAFMPGPPLLGSIRMPIGKDDQLHRFVTTALIQDLVKQGTRHFSARKLNESLSTFLRVLHFITMARANTTAEENIYNEALSAARNYIQAVRLENAKTDAISKPGREMECAILATRCAVQRSHKFLLLREASKLCVKYQNYVAAACVSLAKPHLKPCFAARKTNHPRAV